jgi:DnaK suppressor protein
MAERRIGCLAIVDETGRLAGLLSETDILWAVANAGALHQSQAQTPHFAALDVLVRELGRERERVRARLSRNLASEQSLESVMREEPMDEAERGADVTLVRESIALDELAVRRLAAIDEALDRAAQGHLGTCARCGNAIPIPRLRALPAATLCIACARSEPGANRS